MAERYKCRVAIYLILEKDGKVLLSKRQNTGYKDGFYGLVQGHLEEGEGVKEAMIREAKEEACIDIKLEDLHFSTAGHQNVDMPYVDFVFWADKWQGEIQNGEPDSCGGLEWFDINNIPENTIFQIKKYIEAYKNKDKFLEMYKA